MNTFKTLVFGWSLVWAATVLALFIDVPYAYYAFKQNESTVLLLVPLYVFGVWGAGILLMSFFLWIGSLFSK